MSVAEPRPLSAGPAADAVSDPEVASIVRSLRARLAAPGDVIERVVSEELLRFQEARVRNFIPILVERAAVHRLTRLAGSARGEHAERSACSPTTGDAGGIHLRRVMEASGGGATVSPVGGAVPLATKRRTRLVAGRDHR